MSQTINASHAVYLKKLHKRVGQAFPDLDDECTSVLSDILQYWVVIFEDEDDSTVQCLCETAAATILQFAAKERPALEQSASPASTTFPVHPTHPTQPTHTSSSKARCTLRWINVAYLVDTALHLSCHLHCDVLPFFRGHTAFVAGLFRNEGVRPFYTVVLTDDAALPPSRHQRASRIHFTHCAPSWYVGALTSAQEDPDDCPTTTSANTTFDSNVRLSLLLYLLSRTSPYDHDLDGS